MLLDTAKLAAVSERDPASTADAVADAGHRLPVDHQIRRRPDRGVIVLALRQSGVPAQLDALTIPMSTPVVS